LRARTATKGGTMLVAWRILGKWIARERTGLVLRVTTCRKLLVQKDIFIRFHLHRSAAVGFWGMLSIV
jgi:hypothetical protein